MAPNWVRTLLTYIYHISACKVLEFHQKDKKKDKIWYLTGPVLLAGATVSRSVPASVCGSRSPRYRRPSASLFPLETSSNKKGIRPIPSAEVRRPTAPLSRSRLLENSLTIDEIFFRSAKRSRLHYEFSSLARSLPSFSPPMGEATDIGDGKGLAPPLLPK